MKKPLVTIPVGISSQIKEGIIALVAGESHEVRITKDQNSDRFLIKSGSGCYLLYCSYKTLDNAFKGAILFLKKSPQSETDIKITINETCVDMVSAKWVNAIV